MEIVVSGLEKDTKTHLCFTKDNLFDSDKQSWEEIEFNNMIKIPNGSKGVFIVVKMSDETQWSSKLFYIN